jgi:hypothetical protein
MSKFIGNYGQRINLDEIRKVIFFENGTAEVTYRSGEDERFTEKDDKATIADLKDHTSPWTSVPAVVPAQPGFVLLAFWEDAEGDPDGYDIKGNLRRGTVIAWEYYVGSEDSDPVAISGFIRSDYSNPPADCEQVWIAVQDPTGAVAGQYGANWRNLDEWIAMVRKEWAAIRAARVTQGWAKMDPIERIKLIEASREEKEAAMKRDRERAVG